MAVVFQEYIERGSAKGIKNDLHSLSPLSTTNSTRAIWGGGGKKISATFFSIAPITPIKELVSKTFYFLKEIQKKMARICAPPYHGKYDGKNTI